MVRLFLDDIRNPEECIYLDISLHSLYLDKRWHIVRSYDGFTHWITHYGMPDVISFDHDLAEGHYHKNMQEGKINYDSADFESTQYKTGYHCAKWLIDHCIDNEKKLPEILLCHSMNPVGKKNIDDLFTNYRKFLWKSQ